MTHVWEQLHALDHVDHAFKPVSSDFVYPDSYKELFDWSNTNPYQESIQMFILLAAVCGVGAIILISAGAFCCNYARSTEADDSADADEVGLLGYQHVEAAQQQESNATAKLSKFAKFARYGISALVFICIILSFIFIFILDGTIQDVQTTMDDSYGPYEQVIEDATAINVLTENAIEQCDAIETEADNDQVTSYLEDIKKSLDESDQYLSTFVNEANGIDWEDAGDALTKYREQIFYTCIGLTCFIFILSVLSLCTSEKINVCNGIVSTLVTIGMIVLWIIGSVQFGVSVELADMCADPNDAVIQAINHTSFDTSDNVTVEILQYYVFCDSEHKNNPLINYCNQAYTELLNLTLTMQLLVYYSQDQPYNKSVNNLYHDYNESLYDLVALNDSLNCKYINKYYDDLQDEMCYELLDEWYALYVLQFLIVGFLVLRLCFTCRTSRYRKAARFFTQRQAGPYREYYNEDPVELGHGDGHPVTGAKYAL